MLNLGRRSARQRVAHFMCEMAVRAQAAGVQSGPIYSWPLTQEELGDATGMTSVHTNRTVQSLRRERLVEVGHGEVQVIDWKGLQLAGDFTPNYLHE